MNCASCRKLSCVIGDSEYPSGCPMVTGRTVYEEARRIYEEDEGARRIAVNAA